MKIEKCIEVLGGAILAVRVSARLSGGRLVSVRVSRKLAHTRFYGHASLSLLCDPEPGSCADKRDIGWNGFYHDTTTAKVFEALVRALVEAGLSGEVAECLGSFTRSAMHDAKALALVSDFNA